MLGRLFSPACSRDIRPLPSCTSSQSTGKGDISLSTRMPGKSRTLNGKRPEDKVEYVSWPLGRQAPATWQMTRDERRNSPGRAANPSPSRPVSYDSWVLSLKTEMLLLALRGNGAVDTPPGPSGHAPLVGQRLHQQKRCLTRCRYAVRGDGFPKAHRGGRTSR